MRRVGAAQQSSLDIVARDAVSPHIIADDLLQRTGSALLNSDAQVFVDCFALPQEFETAAGKIRVETQEHLTRMFETVHQKYKSIGLTGMVRHVIQAEYRDAATIAFVHETRLLRATTLLQEPFPAFSIVRNVDGIWRVHSSSYGATEDSIAGRTLNAALHLERA